MSFASLGFQNALIITASAAPPYSPRRRPLFNADTSLLFVLASLLAVGFFRAAHYVASTAIAFADVRPDEVSRASTLSTVIQQISLSIGISFAGVTLFLSGGRNQSLSRRNNSSCPSCRWVSSHCAGRTRFIRQLRAQAGATHARAAEGIMSLKMRRGHARPLRRPKHRC